MTQEPAEHKDFFISYTSKDSTWAEWIALQLEDAGYHTIIQAWDIRPGSNFVFEMNEASKHAERTLLVLSSTYLTSDYAFSEWGVAFRRDPVGKRKQIVPVRIEECDVEGLLGPIVYIDLVKQDEQQARDHLLAGVKRERAKPTQVAFPVVSPQASDKLPTLERPVFPGSLPSIWNVPYPRNLLFTGREELLTQLAASLHTGHPTAISQPPRDSQPQAISGLGGIGKTQVALEYAYRYRSEYRAVLWAQADTKDTLTTSYLELATLLDLPEKDAQESAQVIEAMKRWLQRSTGYLLILDNADDLALAREYLPPSRSGQVLLTTRAQYTGQFAQRVEVDIFPKEQGTLFLLHRAKILSSDATLEQATEQDRSVASHIHEELGGLPLALDQAGAYIEETQSSLVDYLTLYKTQRAEILQERGRLVPDHPLPVATTWSLSFEQVEQQNPTAADILRLCAFLAPDAIPESILTTGIEAVEPLLQGLANNPIALNKAIAVLGAYSLVHRDVSTHTLSLHRLVQAVLKDQMDEENQKQWAERTVLAVRDAFPDVEHQNWPQCELFLPHALMCSKLINRYHLSIPEAADVLTSIGWYLGERGRYIEAVQPVQQAMSIREQQSEVEDFKTAFTMSTLGWIYLQQGKYTEAEPLYNQALTIREEQLGEMHPDTASSLNNLANLYKTQGKYTEAEPLLERSLAIREGQLGAMHPDTAASLSSLASLYYEQGKYGQAEPLYQRALAIDEQQLGAMHPSTAASLSNLALLYETQEKYEQAELLLKRALAIREGQLGAMHPDTAASLNNLALLYNNQGKYGQAESLYQRVLVICEQQLGAMHPNTASSLNNLVLLHKAQGKYAEAEPLLERALAIREGQLGAMHPDTAASLSSLASLYYQQGKYREAEPLLERALAIDKQAYGQEHPNVARNLNNLALLYQDQGKYEQAEPLYRRAVAICEQQLGEEHPNTQVVRDNYASLLREMERG